MIRFPGFSSRKDKTQQDPPQDSPVEPAPRAEPAGDRTPDGADGAAAAASESEADSQAQPTAAVADPAAAAPKKGGWLSRLRAGLSRSSSKLSDGIASIFTKRRLDDEALEELEELLISADIGATTAAKLVGDLAKTRLGKEVGPDEVKTLLADTIAGILDPVAEPLRLAPDLKPHVVLVVGVNGTGKTTTIGKLAKQFRGQGHTVMLAAGDTFRAAAVEQLQIWGERTGCPVVAKETGADAAGLAYEALEKARKAGTDCLMIDTAGRLHNKGALMAELQKIVRVIRKLDDTAPHTVLLTLDATTGQNAHQQVDVFGDMVGVTGLVLTKLDGSARGGVLVSLAERFQLPVHAVGVGESAEDLQPFDPRQFARSLMGLDA